MASAGAGAGAGAGAKGTLYAHQSELPSLPVPALEDTLNKLVESAKPFLDETELEHMEAVVNDFKTGAGPRLQALLEARAAEERNWLEEWWEMFAYLQPRYPSAININWHGLMPAGSKSMPQAESAAMLLRHVLHFRRALVDEVLEPETMAGQKLCMYQYARMFNSCRVPGEEMDAIDVYDDNSLRHIVVLHKNAVYTFDALDADGEVLPYSDIVAQFERVVEAGSGVFDLSRDKPVSVLTSENRTTWAKARDHLKTLDAKNTRTIDIIERAITVVVLEDFAVEGLEALASQALHGDGRNKWFDKPFNMIVFKDGRTGTNGEHSWADAMVVVKMFSDAMATMDKELATTGWPVKGAPSASLPPPEKLEWVLDTTATQAIELASANMSVLIKSVDLRVLEFNHFGKGFIKRYRLVPDFFVQLAIQLAYYRLHNDITAVYESGHTRLFFHGRTDTIRSTTVDSVAFIRSMCNPAEKDADRFALLKTAIATHLAFTRDVLMGKGVDRHLMGLYILSKMTGVTPTPSIFTEKGYLVSKQYKLSTSNISMGDSPIFGGFAAMYEDGYGVCYGLQNAAMKFSISANNNCAATSAARFKVALEEALIDMQRLCLSRNVIYLGDAKM